ncbi:MAG: sulfatase-like hydrolase/transferase [Candidatus Hydrogenedentes bacterium]|nr:sulfatase-like hydrolase/transferase [Candidatus Hydrogenedentota bacterium]
MTRFKHCMLLCVILCAGCGPRTTAPIEETRLNVVLIVADALRMDRVTAEHNGKPLMPKLRQFASESYDYRNAHVQATWTKPSMATIFTSLYPEVHKVLFGIHDTIYEGQPPQADVLSDSLETMARFFKGNGYATAGIQTNANITEAFGFHQGFDSYVFHKYPDYRGRDVTDESIETLKTLNGPFFFYAHYMDTHAPYDPPAPFRDSLGTPPALSADDQALLADYGTSYIDRVLHEMGLTKERHFGNLSPQGEAYIRQRYDEEAAYLDEEVGRLLAYLRENHPNTLIVVTADHGEELWDHGSIGHAKTVYEELSRVPLIVHAPDAPPRAIDAPVETADILPSCAHAAGLAPRREWQGRDIVSNPEGLDPERPVFTSTQASIPGSNVDLECVVVRTNKAIINRKTEQTRYYNLQSDPGEQAPSETSAAEEALREALAAHHRTMEAHPYFGNAGATTSVDAETEEAIKSIGYGR